MKLFGRTKLVVGVAAVMVCAGAATASAAVKWDSTADAPCVRSELDVPQGSTNAVLSAADPAGRFQAGTFRDAGDQVHLLRWEDGEPADLATRGSVFDVSDINAHGDIVATEYAFTEAKYVGLRYRDGVFSQLPGQAPFTDVRPAAINAAGQISGRLDDPATGRTLPAVWSASNELTVLELPADRNTVTIQDIDEAGTVLGTTWYDDGNTGISRWSAIVWYPDGTWRLLPSAQADGESRGTAISAGQVLGASAGTGQLLLWNAGTGQVSPLRGGVNGQPVGINARGSVIGYVEGTDGPVFLPADSTQTRRLPVNDPIIGSGGPAALTDTDVAYGNDGRGDGTNAVVRWDCGS
jgi:hypothetical protein